MFKEKVSVIIPTYNAEDTIEQCLQSIQKSKYKNFEIIIVDDASKDNTITLVKKYPVRLIQLKKNQGPANARNKGAQESKGDILFFIDSDTAMYPDTISQLVKTFQDRSIAVVNGIYSDEPLNKGFFPEYYCLLKYNSFNYPGLTEYNVFASQCAAIRRKIFLSVGGFKKFKWGMDIENEELGSRISRKYKMILNSKVRVKHKFGGFKKLIYIFKNRIYWWVTFFLKHFQFENVLATKSIGIGTLCGPTSFFLFIISVIIPLNTIKFILILLAVIILLIFLGSYQNFYMLCFKKNGIFFMLKSIFTSYFFAFIMVWGAIEAVGHYIIKKISGQKEAWFRL